MTVIPTATIAVAAIVAYNSHGARLSGDLRKVKMIGVLSSNPNSVDTFKPWAVALNV